MYDKKVMESIRDNLELDYEAFSTNDLAIFKSRSFVEGETHFDSYHFVIPRVYVPCILVDKKDLSICKERIFSTNPGQLLQVQLTEDMLVHNNEVQFYAVFIEKQKLSGLAKDIFNTSEVSFDNVNNNLSTTLTELIELFTHEYANRQAGYEFILDSIILQMSVNMLRDLKSNLPYLEEKRRYTSRLEVNKAIDFLWENNDREFCMKDLCSVANLSPYYFIRLFKATTGKTPYEYYMEIKIKKALELFKTGKYSITEIGYILGFSSHSHFSSVFKKQTGMPPSIFIKSAKQYFL